MNHPDLDGNIPTRLDLNGKRKATEVLPVRAVSSH